MLVLLDMDGVLTDFEEGFVREWKKRFPNIPYIPKNKRNDFYVQKQYPENLQKNVDIIMRSRGFSFNLPPMYGAKKAVREMLKAGLKLRICTSPLIRSRFSLQDKYDWTVKHLGREMAKNMIISGDKTLIRADILIDDKPKITGGKKPVWRHILFDAPYNREVDKPRLVSWKDWKKIISPLIGLIS